MKARVFLTHFDVMLQECSEEWHPTWSPNWDSHLLSSTLHFRMWVNSSHRFFRVDTRFPHMYPGLYLTACGCVLSCFSRVWLFVTSWTVACQAPLSIRFPSQESWSELPFPPPEDLPNTGIEPLSPASQADSLPQSYQGSHIKDYIKHTIVIPPCERTAFL